MIALKRMIAVSLFQLLYLQAICQTLAINPSSVDIKSIVMDTVEIQSFATVVQVLWLQDTLSVRIRNEPLKMESAALSNYKKAFRDTTWGTQEEIDLVLAAIKRGAQNCYSYALEKYFENNDVFSQSLFETSSLLYRESAEKILSHYFTEITEFSTSSRLHGEPSIPDQTLLAFFNKSGMASHFVYYQAGVFYSKNGTFEPIEFQSLKKFLKKHYWDTQKIVAYRLNDDQVKRICLGTP